MRTDASPETTPNPRWSVGGVFLEGLAAPDFGRLASGLAPGVRVRALLPPGVMECEGPDAVVGAPSSCLGSASEFELVDGAVGEVGGRLHLSWRLRVRPAPFGIGAGWHLIEQQAHADGGDSIEHLDLFRSGFQPEQHRAGAGVR